MIVHAHIQQSINTPLILLYILYNEYVVAIVLACYGDHSYMIINNHGIIKIKYRIFV